MPKRIQLKRTKGWRLPGNTVVVSRPSKWGNPYKTGDVIPGVGFVYGAAGAVLAYRFYCFPSGVEELRGKNLACWCPMDQPCHADVLLERANAPKHFPPSGGNQETTTNKTTKP